MLRKGQKEVGNNKMSKKKEKILWAVFDDDGDIYSNAIGHSVESALGGYNNDLSIPMSAANYRRELEETKDELKLKGYTISEIVWSKRK